MDTQTLNLFCDVVTRGSFSATAKAQNIDPSVVSRGISGLEHKLGFRLFERSTRRIALTEAGRHYHSRIAPLLEEFGDAANAARDLVEHPKGRLHISASTAFGQTVLVPMLAAFRTRYPEVTLYLDLSDRLVDLIAEEIDVAVRIGPQAPPDTIVSRLMHTRYHVVASPAYLASHPLNSPQDLTTHDCLRFPLPGFREFWTFSNPTGTVDVPVSGSVEIAGALAMREAARAGMGPTLLADWMLGKDLASGRLIDPFPHMQVSAASRDTEPYILTASRNYQPLKTRCFIDSLRAHVKTTNRINGV